jgi:hypothetical protein
MAMKACMKGGPRNTITSLQVKVQTEWMTPNVPNGGRSVPQELVDSRGRTLDGAKRTVGLESQTKHWATPNAHDGRRPGADLKSTQGANLSRDAAVWPTPAARDYRSEQGGVATMDHFNRPSGPSLAAFVTHSPSSPQAPATHDGPKSSSNTDGSRPRLNPAFGCWLMGWPFWWTNPGITSSVKPEMELYRSRLQSHLSSLLGEQESSVDERLAA